MIEQDKAEIEVLRRSQGWQPSYYFLGGEVTFESVGMTASVEDIYDRVQNTDINEWLEKKVQVAQQPTLDEQIN